MTVALPHHGPGRRRLLAGLCAAALLAGCATPPRPAATAGPGQPADAWTGRLGLQVEGQQSQSFSASFSLQGRPEAGELQLFSPVGSTIAVLQWSPTGATLREGQRARGFGSLAELVAQVTGTALPVPALFDWLAGRPSPVPGWEPDLRQQPEGRITAHRTDPQPNATLRIILDR